MAVTKIQPRFEIKEQTEESVVYQRVINPKGRKPKEVEKIVNDLPTATIHTISMEEYEKLKNIEARLVNEFQNKERMTINFKRAFFSFFEL